MRQTGVRALGPNGRERSPHSLCCRAPAAQVLSAQVSKAGGITPRSMGCSVTPTSLQTYLLGKQRGSLLGPAGQCTHITPAADPPPFPDSLQDLLSSHTRERPVSASKKNWQLQTQPEKAEWTSWLFKSIKWKSRSLSFQLWIPTVGTYLREFPA